MIYNTRWGTFQPDGLKRVEERVFKSTSQLTPATNALLIRILWPTVFQITDT